MKRLTERLVENDGAADIESLKSEHMGIYEDLIRLSIQESQEENPVEPIESFLEKPDLKRSGLEKPERVIDSPEPFTEQDEVIPEMTEREEDLEKGVKKQVKTKKIAEEQEYPTLSDLFVPTFNEIKEDMSQKEEFKDTVSLDETEKLFETRKEEIRQLSLNDRLVSNSIQIGLNDRIAFVNKLFNFSQSDFNKALARLNACTTRDEALHYVQYQVKTNYNWKGKEDLEERFISLIERKFMA
jgi:arsenate reductase-like glutaredoxin family protein